jgi:RNase P subunit RPR2
MKKVISKQEAKKEIDKFFQGENFSTEEVRKIKRLAMKSGIKLGEHRKKFCKKCLSKLKGKTRVNATDKRIVCGNCGFENRFKLSF